MELDAITRPNCLATMLPGQLYCTQEIFFKNIKIIAYHNKTKHFHNHLTRVNALLVIAYQGNFTEI